MKDLSFEDKNLRNLRRFRICFLYFSSCFFIFLFIFFLHVSSFFHFFIFFHLLFSLFFLFFFFFFFCFFHVFIFICIIFSPFFVFSFVFPFSLFSSCSSRNQGRGREHVSQPDNCTMAQPDRGERRLVRSQDGIQAIGVIGQLLQLTKGPSSLSCFSFFSILVFSFKNVSSFSFFLYLFQKKFQCWH